MKSRLPKTQAHIISNGNATGFPSNFYPYEINFKNKIISAQREIAHISDIEIGETQTRNIKMRKFTSTSWTMTNNVDNIILISDSLRLVRSI